MKFGEDMKRICLGAQKEWMGNSNINEENCRTRDMGQVTLTSNTRTAKESRREKERERAHCSHTTKKMMMDIKPLCSADCLDIFKKSDMSVLFLKCHTGNYLMAIIKI
jgi:hypothetical protein